VGTSYQLGNLVSSASSTIEATIGERFPLPPKGKTPRYNYGKVICIFMGAVYAYVIILTFIGPEYLGHMFGIAHDQDLEEAVGHDAIEHVVHHDPALIERTGSSEGDEKGDARHHV